MNGKRKEEYILSNDLAENPQLTDTVKAEYCLQALLYLEKHKELLKSERYRTLKEKAFDFCIESKMNLFDGMTKDELIRFFALYIRLESERVQNDFVLTAEIEDFILS